MRFVICWCTVLLFYRNQGRLASAVTSAENALGHAMKAKEMLGEALLKQSQAVKAAVDDADTVITVHHILQ